MYARTLEPAKAHATQRCICLLGAHQDETAALAAAEGTIYLLGHPVLHLGHKHEDLTNREPPHSPVCKKAHTAQRSTACKPPSVCMTTMRFVNTVGTDRRKHGQKCPYTKRVHNVVRRRGTNRSNTPPNMLRATSTLLWQLYFTIAYRQNRHALGFALADAKTADSNGLHDAQSIAKQAGATAPPDPSQGLRKTRHCLRAGAGCFRRLGSLPKQRVLMAKELTTEAMPWR